MARPKLVNARHEKIQISMSKPMKKALEGYAKKEGVMKPAQYGYAWIRDGMKKAGIRWKEVG
jgi:hypothetical protein